MPTMEEMSGIQTSAPKLVLNEIGINGQTGHMIYKNKLKGQVKVNPSDKFGKYEKIGLGSEPIEVTFLKFRRILKEWRREKRALVTNEHNSKSDTVVLFGNDGVVRGKADELRLRFQGLKVQQVVYAIYKGELVRVLIKGARDRKSVV